MLAAPRSGTTGPGELCAAGRAVCQLLGGRAIEHRGVLLERLSPAAGASWAGRSCWSKERGSFVEQGDVGLAPGDIVLGGRPGTEEGSGLLGGESSVGRLAQQRLCPEKIVEQLLG